MKASSAADYTSFRKPQEQSFIMKVTFAILTLFLFYKVILGSISILAKSTDAAKCNDKHAYGMAKERFNDIIMTKVLKNVICSSGVVMVKRMDSK